MKLLIYLVVLLFVLRWIGQVFKPNITHIHINNNGDNSKSSEKKEGDISLSGDVKNTRGNNLGTYTDYEEIK